MDITSFERQLAFHCAPALMGSKCACLMSLSAGDYPKLEALAGQYNARLRGARFLALGRCRERSLLLVYSPALLERALSAPLAKEMLERAGYPVDAPLPQLLRRLMERLRGTGEFPHEVGLFLGYPPEDVAGFLADPGGTGCKLCGCWKVYHDVEGAKRQFRRFELCREWMQSRMAEGLTITDLLGKEKAA